MKDFSKNIISVSATIKEALKKLNDLSNTKSILLFVLNEKHQLVGTLTDGDIRRAFLNGHEIKEPVEAVMNKNFKCLRSNYKLSDIKKFRDNQIYVLPLLDGEGRLIRVINLREQASLLPVDAVIMAGGVGARLRPLTDNTPKPLLKVGDKPIIERNIDWLANFGINKIHITVRYLGEKIVEYFQKSDKETSLDFVWETEPLGTIGALRLIKNFDHQNLLVMNSDLLTNIDFEDFYRQFEEDGADLCVATIPYKIDVPYAVLEVKEEKVQSLKEKPTYTYYANAGIYLFKKELIQFIPEQAVFNATDFIEALIVKGYTVKSYPILEYWLDIGKHEDYKKANEDIKHIKF